MTSQNPKGAARLALLLLLLAVCLPVTSLAQGEMPVLVAPVDYKGVWLSFAAEGFQLYVPDGWYLVQDEGFNGLIITDPTAVWRMSIETFDGEGMTMDGVYEMFRDTPTFKGVGILYFGDIPFVSYDMPDANMFGAVTLAADGSRAYFFKFTPYGNDAFSQLAIKILSTLRPSF